MSDTQYFDIKVFVSCGKDSTVIDVPTIDTQTSPSDDGIQPTVTSKFVSSNALCPINNYQLISGQSDYILA